MQCERDLFNFDAWITNNRLNDLQSSLKALRFDNVASLSSLSEPLIDFILSSHEAVVALESVHKTQLKQQLLDALQPLKSIDTSTASLILHDDISNNNNNKLCRSWSSESSILVITNEENNVLQSLKAKMKSVQEYEESFQSLQRQYQTKHVEARQMHASEVDAMKTCLRDTFERLRAALDKQQQSLLSSIETIAKNELHRDHLDDDDDENDDDEDESNGRCSSFTDEIKQCIQSLQLQKELLTSSMSKYQDIMSSSTKASKDFLDFSDDFSERQQIIASMGNSIDKQFCNAAFKWDNILVSMREKLETEFEFDRHWTFVVGDTMRELAADRYTIGAVHKIKCCHIVDVDWICNGSLVLYTQAPLLSDADGNERQTDEIGNLQLKQYRVRYRYLANDDDDVNDHDEDEDKTQDDDDDEEEEEEEAAMNGGHANECRWRSGEWIEITFDNAESQFLSTIPLKIVPYSAANDNGAWHACSFGELTRFMSIEVQICCEFRLLRESMSFWTPYCAVHSVTHSNVVANQHNAHSERHNEEHNGSVENMHMHANGNGNDSNSNSNSNNNGNGSVPNSEHNHHRNDHDHDHDDENRPDNMRHDLALVNNNRKRGSLSMAAAAEGVGGGGGLSALNMDEKELEAYTNLCAQNLRNLRQRPLHAYTEVPSTSAVDLSDLSMSYPMQMAHFNISQHLHASLSQGSSPPRARSSQKLHNTKPSSSQQQSTQAHAQTQLVEPPPPPPLPPLQPGNEASAVQRRASTTQNSSMNLEVALSELVDAEQVGDTLLLQSGMVRAWRYDDEQDKWRGRGKGNLCIYKNTLSDSVRIVFKDVKHENKVRLLQRIDISYQHCTVNFLNEIEWLGSDYSMDMNDPLHSLWKIKFIDEPQMVPAFARVFNNAVDECLRNID